MTHYTGQALRVELDGVMLPGIREVTIPEEHPAPDTTHTADAHGTSIAGGITYHTGTVLFVDQSGGTSWNALAPGTIGTLIVYPQGKVIGKPKVTMSIVVTERDRVLDFTNAVPFMVTFKVNSYRTGFYGVISELYIATVKLGMFHTGSFPQAGEEWQPVWSSDNAGLPDMSVSTNTLVDFGADPVNTRQQICVVRNADVSPARCTIYARADAGVWMVSLTEEQVETVTGVGVTLYWRDAVYDRLGGHIWAIYTKASAASSQREYLFRSDDNGMSWNYVSNFSLNSFYAYNAQLSVRGSEVALAGGFFAGGSQALTYSCDGGMNFPRIVGLSTTNIAFPFLFDDDFYTIRGDGPGTPYDLIRVDKSTLALTKLLDDYDLGPQHSDALWQDVFNATHGRLLKFNKLWITEDGWASLVETSPTEFTPTLQRHFVPVEDNPDDIILTKDVPGEQYPHTVYVMRGEGGTPAGCSGENPGSFPYPGSIPYTCGGICIRGVVAT